MRLRLRRDRRQAAQTVRLYYASDVHGSERCWRKFLNAATAYSVSALVMGGDLTGKAIVPIERREVGYATTFLGEQRLATSEDELAELLDAIRFNGMYPWIAVSDEIGRYASGAADTDDLFEQIIVEEIGRWARLADERAGAAPDGVFVMAGNDDPWAVDDALRACESISFCDEAVVQVGPHEMISCSYANPTPWNSPRELPEDELYRKLSGLAAQLSDPASAIFNLHVPPYDSQLDLAAQLDDDLKVVTSGGSPVMVPVGSRAVREIIEEYQPLLAVHGHIHESRGLTTIGRTTVLNPGSEYNNGTIHGAVVALAKDRVVTRQLVVG